MSGGGEAAQVLAERERVIDALYRQVKERVGREILLHAPVASDLRFLLSVLRIVPELERSHDLVMQIASVAGRVSGEDLSPRSRGLPSGWVTLPPACGARPRIPGTCGTVRPRRSWHQSGLDCLNGRSRWEGRAQHPTTPTLFPQSAACWRSSASLTH
jgi:hypothetical protein